MEMRKKTKKSGPQGPTVTGAYDAKSKKNKPMNSYVEGTKTNKNPNIKGLTRMPKGYKEVC
jgi:hypothetical protein